MLFVVVQDGDHPNAAQIRKETREQHIEYLNANHGRIVLASAMLKPDAADRIGSCVLLNVTALYEAEQFVRDDPFTKAGLFGTTKIFRMRRGLWNSAAMPSTAEEN